MFTRKKTISIYNDLSGSVPINNLRQFNMSVEPKTGGSVHHIDYLENELPRPKLRKHQDLILDPESNKADGLKSSSDGHIVLIPQPSENPKDPLNWSSNKKHVVLFIIVACSFLPDYGSVTGAATLTLQAK